MLENLINTKVKRILLNILFQFPERSFSVQELKAMTGTSMAGINEALRDFLRLQVANMASRKRQRYYRLNPHFHMLTELKDLAFEPGFSVSDEIAKLLKSLPGLKLGILSGVFTLQPQLPLDLLLVSDELNRTKLQRVLSEISDIAGEEINFSLIGEDEYEHRQMMNDRFVRDVLDYPHIVVVNNLRKQKN